MSSRSASFEQLRQTTSETRHRRPWNTNLILPVGKHSVIRAELEPLRADAASFRALDIIIIISNIIIIIIIIIIICGRYSPR
jgi:hypothetical protein